MRVLLLPGMDGTGELFGRFEAALASTRSELAPRRVVYPRDRILDYDALELRVRAELEADPAPKAIIAESYSGPLAIRLGARPPRQLRAVVIVASFALAPLARWQASALARLGFRRPPPRFALRRAMLDRHADPELIEAVRAAVSSVAPEVLGARARELAELDLRDPLAALELPLAWLRARRDRLVRLGLPRLPPGAECIEIDGPHLLLQARPKACAEAIAGFLARFDA